MKKVLSLLMMAMLAIGAWAAEESIELTAEAQGYANGDLVTTVQGDVVTLTFDKASSSTAPAYYSTGDAVRLYSGGTMTITAGGNTITQVVFVYELNGSATVSVTPGTYDESSKTWTGSATEVVMTAGTAKHVRISKVTVTYEVGEAPAVATPEIAGETPFTESSEVTITCATEGATIYYTTDGGDPTNEDAIYAGPFPITETTTVKAIAYDATGAASSVATKKFVKEEVQNNSVATVAEFNALADNTECTFTGTLVVSAQTGQYLYAQDATGGMLIYGAINQNYNKLDVIPAGWTCKKTTFKGAPEAANPAGLAAATTQGNLAPEEMTPAQVNLANAFKYAVIRGATISGTTLTVGEESTTLYNRFGVTMPTDNATYDVIGVTGYYNTPQFMPLEFVAQGVEVATPVISGETPFIGSTMVTITCEDEGVSIHYTIDGTDPTINSTEYTAPFELTESATVKAIAFNEAEDCSAIASKEFVKTITVATVAEYNDLAEGTNFVFTGNLVVSGQKGKYLYAQDSTGGVLIYGTAPSFTKGDVIPSGFSATKTNYNGTIEMTNFILSAATETAEIVAVEVVPAQWEEDGINIYAVIKGATINGSNLVVGENSVATYNRFGVTAPTDTEKAYDVYGVTSWYNNAPQFYPLEYVEAVEPVVENTITFVAEQEGGTVSVALADGTPVESGVTKVAAGDKVTVTATPAEGYKISSIEVKCGDEVVEFDAEETTGRAAESHTFTMPEGEVNIEVTFEEETPTAISTISMENVKAVRYYNVAGVESATPFQGVNIVVREMNDGSKSVIKVVK